MLIIMACSVFGHPRFFLKGSTLPRVASCCAGVSAFTHCATLQVSVVSTIIATLFLRTTLHSSSVSDGQTYLGLIFFAIIHMVQELSLPHSHATCCSQPCTL